MDERRPAPTPSRPKLPAGLQIHMGPCAGGWTDPHPHTHARGTWIYPPSAPWVDTGHTTRGAAHCTPTQLSRRRAIRTAARWPGPAIAAARRRVLCAVTVSGPPRARPLIGGLCRQGAHPDAVPIVCSRQCRSCTPCSSHTLSTHTSSTCRHRHVQIKIYTARRPGRQRVSEPGSASSDQTRTVRRHTKAGRVRQGRSCLAPPGTPSCGPGQVNTAARPPPTLLANAKAYRCRRPHAATPQSPPLRPDTASLCTYLIQ